MRDVIITLMVFGALPFIFRNPSYGMAAWIWILRSSSFPIFKTLLS